MLRSLRVVLLLFVLGLAAGGGVLRAAISVLDHGAVGDGGTKNTAAFARAIAAAHALGGGTVVVPAGRYLTGAIFLESNLTLHLEAGAELLYSGDPADSPLVPARWECVNVYTHAPLIYAHGKTNIAITGRGTLNGQGELWWWRNANHDPARRAEAQPAADEWKKILPRIQAGEKFTKDDFAFVAQFLRPSLIVPYECRNVLIEGVTVINSPFWNIHPTFCDNVVVRGVTVISRGPNGDGLDIDSCRDVRVSDCTFDTGDDCIAIKSGRDADGRRTARPSEYITITNCVMNRGHGAVAIGSETSGDVRYVTASNIVCNGTDFGIRVKTQRARGGVVEHVRFSDWVIRGGKEEAIEITSDYRRDLPEEPRSERTPTLRDIAIDNVTIVDGAEFLNLNGLTEQFVENIRVSNVRGNAKLGVEVFEADGVELSHIAVAVADGAPFVFANARRLKLDHLSSSAVPAGAPFIHFNNVTDAVLASTEAPAGATPFLRVDGASSAIRVHPVDSAAPPVITLGNGVPADAVRVR